MHLRLSRFHKVPADHFERKEKIQKFTKQETDDVYIKMN